MDSSVVPYPPAKKAADKGISAGLLVLLAPVFAVAYVAIGLDRLPAPSDRGPWLYRERRVSRGREFDVLKFRTLRRAALERQREGEAHARLLEKDPENLTWAGRSPGPQYWPKVRILVQFWYGFLCNSLTWGGARVSYVRTRGLGAIRMVGSRA